MEEGLTTERTESTEERKRHDELRKIEFILSFKSEAGLVGVEGDEAAHGDGALGDEALDRGECGRGGGGEAVADFLGTES